MSPYGAAGRDRTRDISVRSRALYPTEVLPQFCGSRSWARTSDLVLNRHLLYQLSYAGMMNNDEPAPNTIAGTTGAPGRNRTVCATLFRRSLYQ